MPPKRTMPPRRASMRPSTRQGARGTSAASPSSFPTTRKRQQLALEAVSPARVFPMLDDMVAGVVLTYLPSEELGTSALINKAWQASNSNESLWRPFLATADPISTLGEARLVELAAKFSCKQVNAPSILRSLTVNRIEFFLEEYYDDCEYGWEGGMPPDVGPAVSVVGDVLLDGCTFGMCTLGAAAALQFGRLVARANTFQDSMVGLSVIPLSGTTHRETTVHLEGNRFAQCHAWGLLKGPGRCHPQDNDAVLKANTFWDNDEGAICEYQGA